MTHETGNTSLPQKYIIEKPHLMETFHNSSSFVKVLAYVQSCAEAVEGMSRSAWLHQRPEGVHPVVAFFTEVFFPHLRAIVADVPLEDMKQQRFGNRAFRVFHSRLEGEIAALMRRLVSVIRCNCAAAVGYKSENIGADDVGGTGKGDNEDELLALELAEYMKDSFGNSVRIDYGTGHELHFFIAITICMQECGDNGGALESDLPIIVPHKLPRPQPPPADQRDALLTLRRSMVFDVFTAYLAFMRHLQHHYKLEPAGSHGVWGLDDYHHLPFIFGAAQLIDKELPPPAPSSDHPSGERINSCDTDSGVILPKHVCEEAHVRKHAEDYLYFSQVLWVIENKIGPFFEHSSMLYNISGVESWRKTYTGMVKMYAAEVLLKFNVVQHLLFGRYIAWPQQ